jgi:hypothetical protein
MDRGQVGDIPEDRRTSKSDVLLTFLRLGTRDLSSVHSEDLSDMLEEAKALLRRLPSLAKSKSQQTQQTGADKLEGDVLLLMGTYLLGIVDHLMAEISRQSLSYAPFDEYKELYDFTSIAELAAKDQIVWDDHLLRSLNRRASSLLLGASKRSVLAYRDTMTVVAPYESLSGRNFAMAVE